ncbi:DUF3885 domain-containing protein [Virgibacillus pantothenticus]|uniref:DUF3885 domain-containing protein n=1 Tax=Virgibacillus pantothenticus TaxID=1473 RepID=UPI0014804B2D|nr:DUF3885 domain-containing protein [Virgibacillus pantothenticus]
MTFHQWWSSIYQNGLLAPLFYTMPVGLRFEIGPVEYSTSDPNYFKIAEQRAQMIWNDLFKPEEEVYVVLQKYHARTKTYRRHRFLDRYFYERPALCQLSYEVLPNPYDDEDDETKLHRFAVKTTVANVKKRAWIQKCIWKDFTGKGIFNDFELYIVRIKDGVVYYLYDDRGLDVAGKAKAPLQALYDSRTSFLLEYDRQRMDQQFAVR